MICGADRSAFSLHALRSAAMASRACSSAGTSFWLDGQKVIALLSH